MGIGAQVVLTLLFLVGMVAARPRPPLPRALPSEVPPLVDTVLVLGLAGMADGTDVELLLLFLAGTTAARSRPSLPRLLPSDVPPRVGLAPTPGLAGMVASEAADL